MADNFDDKPIGATNRMEIDQYPPEFDPNQLVSETPSVPIPIEKRLESKVWKVRREALDELIRMLPTDPEAFSPYSKQTIVLISDMQWICQERALKLVLASIKSRIDLMVAEKELILCLIRKCLISDKEEVYGNARDIIYQLYDNGHAKTVLSELNCELLSKNQKICSSTIKFLTDIVHDYGARRLENLSLFIQNLGYLANIPKPVGKKETICLYKQLYRWIGDQIWSYQLHHEVKEELVKYVKAYVREDVKPVRGIGTSMEKKTDSQATNHAMENKQVFKEDDTASDPVDVLLQFDSRWVDKTLDEPKWKEKKAILDQFIRKLNVKVILNREHSHFITLIKRLMGENNINLLQCGFKITTLLSRGLKKHFSQTTKSVLDCVFSRLRDSKAMIVDEAQVTLEAMAGCINLEEMSQMVKEGLNDKSPNMRCQVIMLLTRLATKRDNKTVSQMKTLVDKIIKMNEDGSADVRQAVLTFLCKLKSVHGIKFFGDKLKALPSKKVSVIENSPTEPALIETINEETSIVSSKRTLNDSQSNFGMASKASMLPSLPIPPPTMQSMVLQQVHAPITPQSSSTELKMTTDSRPNPSIKQFTSLTESIRLSAYQQFLSKPVTSDQVLALKSRMVRQQSLNVQKLILSLLNAQSLTVPQAELLVLCQWQKSSKLLKDFLVNKKVPQEAVEVLRRSGIMPKKESQQTNSMSIKAFFTELQLLVGRMSNPLTANKIEAAQNTMALLQQIGKFPQTDTSTNANGGQQILTQLYNVLKCRLQEYDEQLFKRFAELTCEFVRKGFITKVRGGRIVVPVVIARLCEKKPYIEQLVQELATACPTILFQFFPLQLAKAQLVKPILQFILVHNELFTRNGDLKSFMLPLLQLQDNPQVDADSVRMSEMLLDQIVELCGQQALQKVVKDSKITCGKNYLSKWNIQHEAATKSASNITAFPSKIERLLAEQMQPWPIYATSQHVLSLISLFTSLGEPFLELASPLPLKFTHFQLLTNLSQQFLYQYSDLLCKWLYWRLQIERPHTIGSLFQFSRQFLSVLVGRLHDTQASILMSALFNYMESNRKYSNGQVCTLIQMVNDAVKGYKQKSFRFWLDQMAAEEVFTEDLVVILIGCYEDLISQEMVTLSRLPLLAKNALFLDYLKRSNVDPSLMMVMGFKTSSKDLTTQNRSAHLSSMSLPEEQITIDPTESKLFLEMFKKCNSDELIGRIRDYCSQVANSGVMMVHLRILQSAIVPFMDRELPYINVYEYFKFLQNKTLSSPEYTASAETCLLPLTRTLVYFLIDLDFLKMDNKAEMMKLVNKLLLIQLEQADSKHMLEVLMTILRSRMVTQDPIKLIHLLPKCLAKVVKGPQFKFNLDHNLTYLLTSFLALLNDYRLTEQMPIYKSAMILMQDIVKSFPTQTVHLLTGLASQYDSLVTEVVNQIISQANKTMMVATETTTTTHTANLNPQNNTNASNNINQFSPTIKLHNASQQNINNGLGSSLMGAQGVSNSKDEQQLKLRVAAVISDNLGPKRLIGE